MYSYPPGPPHGDQEDVFTDFGGAHIYPHDFLPQAYLDDPSWTQLQQASQLQHESHDIGGAVGEMLNFNEDQVRLLFRVN
jgi:hypothetical protein